MKCPKCKSEKGFRVVGWELLCENFYLDEEFEVADSKHVDTVGSGIYPGSEVRCMECGHEDDLRRFTKEKTVGHYAIVDSPPQYASSMLARLTTAQLTKELNKRKKAAACRRK